MMKSRLIFTLFVLNLHAKISGAQSLDEIDFAKTQEHALTIGEELWNVGNAITKRAEVQESFSQARVVKKNGSGLVDEIVKDIKVMLDVRVHAVKRIVKTAEKIPRVYWNTTDYNNTHYEVTRDRDTWRDVKVKEDLAEAQRLEKLSMDENYKKNRTVKNYDVPPCWTSHDWDETEEDGEDYGCSVKVNETINLKAKEASVFVTQDVFDRDLNMSWAMYRTKGLDKAFFNNYKIDKTIGWQYFCNSTGYMRHFPAVEWKVHPINTYDCRMRKWFTGAAVSPKDIIILIERSGSMNGTRISIAIDVVRYILDTLTPNDFFNVLKFNDTAEYVQNCTFRKLIQATSTNIFEMKQALETIKPHGRTDLAEALYEAFDNLEMNRNSSAKCNQAIVLITDGMEYNQTIQDIFKKYNWDKGNKTRVFSYLVGQQIPESEYEQVRLMACNNRGFYMQIDTHTETRENAMRYINVMARPMVFNKSISSPVVWSALYADFLDAIRVTNHDWSCKQNEVQRKRVVSYLKNYDQFPCISENSPEQDNPEFRKYVFMTTVSMPAFDRGINETLMGVAAIDVPLYEFERLFQKYHLGVGGYAFIIDQNGKILSHPDFRPLFQATILKPNYDDVDLADVELIDDGYNPRNYSSFLLEFRESIITRPWGSKYMFVVQPYDDMRRAFRLKRNYFWKRIDTTPFTVVVSYPENSVGRVSIPENIDSMMSQGSDLDKYFEGSNFKLHPDWIYCRALRKSFEDMKLGEIDPDNCEMEPEEELLFYFDKFESIGWKWKNDKVIDFNDTKCDRKLLQSLLFDAKMTVDFPHDVFKRSKEHFKFDIKTSFIATHSGLLRYKIFDKSIPSEKFGNEMKRSIDEVWYKHAVEYNRIDPLSFVYSVPYNAYDEDYPHITATHAIFIDKKTPIAVVGFQFAHSSLEQMTENLCSRRKMELCYVLDDNAYILSDPDALHAGKFFGSIERKIMHILIEEKVYEPIKVYDYQAVCYQDRELVYEKLMKIRNAAFSVVLWNPFKSILAALTTLLTTVHSLSTFMSNMMYPDGEFHYDDDVNSNFHCTDFTKDDDFITCLNKYGVTVKDNETEGFLKCKNSRFKKCRDENATMNILKRHVTRTRPIKCDKFNLVYSLTKDESNFKKPYDECSRPFVVHKIPHSNLILIVTNRNCAQVFETGRTFDDEPKTIEYVNDSMLCHKMEMDQLFRIRPSFCANFYEYETEFNQSNKHGNSHCGRGHKLELHSLILTLSFTFSLLKLFISM